MTFDTTSLLVERDPDAALPAAETAIQAKQDLRDEIDADIQRFLAQGGAIRTVGIVRQSAAELAEINNSWRSSPPAESKPESPAPESPRPVLVPSSMKEPVKATRKITKQKPAATPPEEPVMQHQTEANGVAAAPVAPVDIESRPITGNNNKPVMIDACPVVMDAERVMPRIRDTLFRELADIQNGQASSERTAAVLMIVDKIVDSLDYDGPQTLVQTINTPLGQESAQLTHGIMNRETSAPVAKLQPQTVRGKPGNPVWEGRSEVKALMEKYNISASSIQKKLGDGASGLHGWLNGKWNPPASTATNIELTVHSMVLDAKARREAT